MDIIKGKTWTFGENIDTDVIIPGRYLRTFNPQDLADHVLEGERPDFTENVKSGDIIVADENFGCGSSREQAPVAIKTAGVSAIVAKSFARIFYRNAINIGLPVIVSDIEAKDGDIVIIAGSSVTAPSLHRSFVYTRNRSPTRAENFSQKASSEACVL